MPGASRIFSRERSAAVRFPDDRGQDELATYPKYRASSESQHLLPAHRLKVIEDSGNDVGIVDSGNDLNRTPAMLADLDIDPNCPF